jgi:hypothetical protein
MGSTGTERGEKRTAYLPPRAARARKLILRTQLGLPWVIAALAFAGLILLAGAFFLVQTGRPGAPWVRVGPASAFQPTTVLQIQAPDGRLVVVDRRDGLLRTFQAPGGPCAVEGAVESGFSRPCTGQTWDADGVATSPSGGAALRRVPAQVARGDLYVDL